MNTPTALVQLELSDHDIQHMSASLSLSDHQCHLILQIRTEQVRKEANTRP